LTGTLKQAERLLRGGAVLGVMFDLYEAHIPFKMQFFAECNLYGM
jgi:hypothetical protein